MAAYGRRNDNWGMSRAAPAPAALPPYRPGRRKPNRPPPGLEKLDMSLDEIVQRGGGGRPREAPVGSAGPQTWGAQRPKQQQAWQRQEPYSHERGKDAEQSKEYSGGRKRGKAGVYKECKVLPGSDVKQTAGYIAVSMRQGGTLTVSSESAESLNQAVKSIALARAYLEDEAFDVTVRAADGDGADVEVELQISPTADDWVRQEISNSEAKELIVSSGSDPSRVAGAIAKNVREEVQVYCTAMGPQAVLRVAKSISLARSYLDGEGVELCFVPQFAHTEDGASVLHVYVFSIFRDCLVKADSDVHGTAGYLAAGVRSYVPPVVVADSAGSANQAMKALALTRNFLASEDLDVIVQPLFPDFYQDSSTCNMRLLISVSDASIRDQLDTDSAMQLYVSSESDPGKVAGAIARSARSGGGIYCTAMGPQAILRVAKSIFLARKYLEADAIFPYFVPEFGKSSDGASLMHIHVIVQTSF